MVKRFKKKRWLFLFLLALTGVVSIIVYFNFGTAKVSADPIQPISVNELSQEAVDGANFLLTGVVKPKDKRSIAIDSKLGKVMETLVNEGDQVTAGQELFRYVNPENEFEVRKAQLAVENQEKTVNQKQEDANYRWTRYNEKNNELAKLQQKINQASGEEKTAYQQEKTALEEIVSQCLSDARLADSEVGNAQLELEAAQLELTAAGELYGQNTVTSEIDGTVMKIDQKQLNNGVSDNNEAFMEIVDRSSMYVEGKIDEFRKDQLQLEQEAAVIDRSDDTQSWLGKITKVGDLASGEDSSDQESDENPNLSKYPYRLLLNNEEAMPAIDRNMYVSVKPAVNEGELFLPADYLFKEKDQYYVWKVVKKKLRKSPVKIEENVLNGNAKIIEGLNGEDALVYPNESLKEGGSVDKNAKAN